MNTSDQAEGGIGHKADLVGSGHFPRSHTHQVPAIRRSAEEVAEIVTHFPTAGMFKDHIRVGLRQRQGGILVVEAGGNDHFGTFGDHVFHGGRRAGFIVYIFGCQDLNTGDILS